MPDRRTFGLLAAAVAAAYVGNTIATGLGTWAAFVGVAVHVVAVALLVIAVAEIVTGRPTGGPDGTGVLLPLAGFVGITVLAVLGLEMAGGSHTVWMNLVFVMVVAAVLGLFALAGVAADHGPAKHAGPGEATADAARALKRRRWRRRRARRAEATETADDGDGAGAGEDAAASDSEPAR